VNNLRTPLLVTKLSVPPLRPATLQREHMLTLLSGEPGVRLVLLSAPAGFGKTTLLASWCHTLLSSGERAVAWVALDAGDNEPRRFIAYLAAALAHAFPDSDEIARIAAIGEGDITIEATLVRLINALAACQRPCVLVLDDYHTINAPPVHVAVAFLLDHMPDQLCLVIASRSDPPLPLALLRTRRQLAELRAADLRFTPGEIKRFLQEFAQLDLSSADIAEIDAYVEGWPAGVQLVALSLHSHAPDATRGQLATPVRKQLPDSQQHIFAYLADEVFSRQPADLQHFLLATSVLDRMTAPLCDAIIAGDQAGAVRRSSAQALEALDHANLFVAPLDSERRWYRYHHLFHSFLSDRLAREAPDLALALHDRASVWMAANDMPALAIDHAFQAQNVARAADLIEQLASSLIERGEYATLQGWLAQIPESLRATCPALDLWTAWAALLTGAVEHIDALLERAARVWASAGDRARLGALSHLRAHLARLRGDGPTAIAEARKVLADPLATSETVRAGSKLALGAGLLLLGDLGAAQTMLESAYAACCAHNFLAMLVTLNCLGDAMRQRAQLGEAAVQHEQVLAHVGERGFLVRWEAAVRLGDIARERNDLASAEHTLAPRLLQPKQMALRCICRRGMSRSRGLWRRVPTRTARRIAWNGRSSRRDASLPPRTSA
jgi:LuxR family maltose regulon positive regulatory protein